MKGRALLLATVVAVGAGATAAAVQWPATSASHLPAHDAMPGRMFLPTTGVAAIPVCPGPETLVAPAGGEAVTPGGPVAVTGLLQGRSGTLGARPLVVGDAGIGVLTLARTSAGPIALSPALQGGGDATAPAMSLVQLSLARQGDLRGVAALACSTASTQTWLVGGGTQAGRRGRLLLANPAATPAVVDVTVHGPKGTVVAPGGTGIVVPPMGQVALLIDALAPDLDAVAVQVKARRGRVTAVLHDTWVRGVTPGGVDDVTAAAPAAARQFVPGVSVAPPSGVPLPAHPGDPGAVAVRVANPGGVAAVARVWLVGGSGPFALDKGVVTVAPGAVVDVPIAAAPAGTYTAVVEADVPVLAGAVVGRSVAGGGAAGTAQPVAGVVPPSEFGWAPSVEPITGPVLVALPEVTEDGRRTAIGATLALTALGDATGVEVTELDANGAALRTVTVSVPSGSSRERALDGAATGVRLRPVSASASVVAALVLQVQDSSGPMVSVMPVRPGPAGGGVRPQVVADVRVGMRS